MTRPKKYKKSIKQTLKENAKQIDSLKLFYRTTIMPKTCLAIIKKINNEPNLELRTKLIASLSRQTFQNVEDKN